MNEYELDRLKEANRVAQQLRYNLTEALRLNKELCEMKIFE